MTNRPVFFVLPFLMLLGACATGPVADSNPDSASVTTTTMEPLVPADGDLTRQPLAEIAAALVVAGELSLGAATRVDKETRRNEWVDAHERLGRNR